MPLCFSHEGYKQPQQLLILSYFLSMLPYLVTLIAILMLLRDEDDPIGKIRLPRRGDVRVKRVLVLMLPVSVGLGLININLLLNSTISSLVSDEVPRAVDAAR